jgi:hypothetical protein
VDGNLKIRGVKGKKGNEIMFDFSMLFIGMNDATESKIVKLLKPFKLSP